jgi:hypothetical protein
MSAKRLLSMIACMGGISGVSVEIGWAVPPEGLDAFVQSAAADLSSSPLQIPQFKSAVLDRIEDLGKENGIDRYLCWLKSGPNRIGYIAVAGDSKSFQVFAFSATISSPGYFLDHLETTQLSPKSLDFSRVDHLPFVENVPLVTAVRTFWGTQPLEMSETAAGLSSLFNYVQNEKGILLFGHPGAESNPEYKQRTLKESAAGRSRTDPNRESFEKECREAKSRVKVPQRRTDEEDVTYRVQVRNLIKPIIRRTLLDPINAYEHLRALQAEQTDTVTLLDISPGMKDAVLLQMDYLDDGSANIKRNLELFLKTRGRAANVSTVPFAKVPADALPAVVIGPDNIAGVVLGKADIDGEQFSLVFFPKTGKPNRMSLADAIRTRGGGLADPNRARTPEERERLARARKKMETTIIAEDPKSKLPDSLSVGIHVCRTSSLAQWQAVDIGKIDLADNWGLSER